MFDAMFSLNDRRMPLVILLIVDGNGESQIVGLFLAISEIADILNALLAHFKDDNPKHNEIDVILTDKGHANLNAVSAQFPNAAHHLCVFHVAQAFEREITTIKRQITIKQRNTCLSILNKMMYCQSQNQYNLLYNELLDTRCAQVIEYFNNNWHNITEQWVRFHITKHMMFGNATTNRVESLNQKLKAVIEKYSSLPRFFNNMMNSVGAIWVEKDIRAAEDVMRKPVNTANHEAHDHKYAKILTQFAFNKYFAETGDYGTVQFMNIFPKMGVTG